jgi:hypothetical protein
MQDRWHRCQRGHAQHGEKEYFDRVAPWQRDRATVRGWQLRRCAVPARIAVLSRPPGWGEMARMLAPGDRVSLNVWGALDRQPSYVALVDGIDTFFGVQAKTTFDLVFSLHWTL